MQQRAYEDESSQSSDGEKEYKFENNEKNAWEPIPAENVKDIETFNIKQKDSKTLQQ